MIPADSIPVNDRSQGKPKPRLPRFGSLFHAAFPRPESAAGFTLIELMVVMLIIGILASIAIPSYMSSIHAAREAVLREDLHVMRHAIDAYTSDKDKAPQSLDDLVTSGYLKAIPVDPFTHSSSSWVPDMGDTYESLDQTASGITDVHSGSDQTGTNGKAYSSW